MILGPFLDGIREAGSEVEVLYTSKLNIKPCLGDFHCWLEDPSVCIQDDDMREVLPKIPWADIIILACPLYSNFMPGPLKTFIDRTTPLGNPFAKSNNARSSEGRTRTLETGRLALVSSCGFWEKENFDFLVTWMKAFCKSVPAEFCGALLRPHAPAMQAMKASGAPIDDLFDAAREAGHLIVTQGTIPQGLLQTISRPLLPRETYMAIAGKHFDKAT
jgi:putative NADPH-quinone reductase